ncbi:MDR family MFS transporter [Steroidobacter gossypii]|uniref:MDR family MFS transporter n=1 Tax=Steroidobacter gossypii TaxID=2805490 RepID=UPI001C3FBBDF|nr:MDR family MFS transporter [Steroidobacter gossypii]
MNDSSDLQISSAEKRLTLAALAVVVLLSALDQTIVATAMPRIIEELQGLSMYAWVTTAYLLTSTVSVPLYGKLSDQYGRKPILIVGVLMFLVGSALCGLSGEFGRLPVLGDGMMQLVVFRALQGLGGGALMTVSFAVMADMYPPRERGRLFGVFGSVFGLATVVGPFIGGFFTDHGTVTLARYEIAGWRWVFYVNLPLGALALFMIVYRMPALRKGGGGEIDYLGALLIVLTAGTALLGLTLGGTHHAWDSPEIVGLFAASALSLVIFILVERRAREPILPLPLFSIPTFRTATLGSFVMSMAFLGVVMFMPLYMQVVQGVTATQSGVALLPLMIALIVSSIGSGRIVHRTGKYKLLMVAGAVVLFAGVVSLTGLTADTTQADLSWRLVLTGLGLGPAQSLFSLVIQNAAPADQVGVATSTSQFSRQIGSTVGVAIFGTLLTHALTAELPRHVPQLPGNRISQLDLAHAQSQAMNVEEIRARVQHAIDERYEVIERAYREDPEAVAEVLGDPRLPDSVKAPLRDGGIRARIHDELVERTDALVAALKDGEDGRDRLLQDPILSPTMKRQLANIPSRAWNEPQVIADVADLFRDSLLATEDAIVAERSGQALMMVKAGMANYVDRLVEDIHRGTKVAFAAAIAHMLEQSLWIVGLALLVVLFLPELPLRAKPAADSAAST